MNVIKIVRRGDRYIFAWIYDGVSLKRVPVIDYEMQVLTTDVLQLYIEELEINET